MDYAHFSEKMGGGYSPPLSPLLLTPVIMQHDHVIARAVHAYMHAAELTQQKAKKLSWHFTATSDKSIEL